MSTRTFQATPSNVVIVADGRVAHVTREYADANGIIELLIAGDYDKALDLADRSRAIVRHSEGEFTVEGGVVKRNGVAVHNVITQRILEFVEAGLPFAPLLKFLNNLHQNPSARAVEELYTFLENRYMPITDDGHFIAYKGVRTDYYSITSGRLTLLSGKEQNGRIYNAPGQVIECVRNEVDDEKDRTCSKGLHAGALEYAQSFGSGGRVVIVKINPRDAVSVPSDHNAQKLRACRYEVVGDFVSAFVDPLVTVGASAPAVSGDEDEDGEECPNCGSSADFDGDYCGECGESVSDGEDDEY